MRSCLVIQETKAGFCWNYITKNINKVENINAVVDYNSVINSKNDNVFQHYLLLQFGDD